MSETSVAPALEMASQFEEPVLHGIYSVRHLTPEEDGSYLVDVELTDMHGERSRCEYVSRPGDPFGLAPTIRKWLAATELPILPFVLPVITSAEVDAERDRRTTSGFVFNGVLYQSRQQDIENITGASIAAAAAVAAGAMPGDYRWHGGESDFVWIDAENNLHPLDAQSTFALGQAAMANKQAHIFAARALKDLDPIPQDFASNDTYWP